MSDKMSEVEAAKKAVTDDRVCSTCGALVYYDNGDCTFNCGCSSGWMWKSKFDAASKLSLLTEDAPPRVIEAMRRITNRLAVIAKDGKFDERDNQFVENELLDVWDHHQIVPASPVGELDGAFEAMLDKWNNLAEAATQGPWMIYPQGKKNHTRIGTAYDHGQLKAPLGVVNECIAVDEPRMRLSIRDEDSAYISYSNPAFALGMIKKIRAALSSKPALEGIPERPQWGKLGAGVEAHLSKLEAIISAKDAENDRLNFALGVKVEGIPAIHSLVEHSNKEKSRADAAEALVATRDAEIAAGRSKYNDYRKSMSDELGMEHNRAEAADAELASLRASSAKVLEEGKAKGLKSAIKAVMEQKSPCDGSSEWMSANCVLDGSVTAILSLLPTSPESQEGKQ